MQDEIEYLNTGGVVGLGTCGTPRILFDSQSVPGDDAPGDDSDMRAIEGKCHAPRERAVWQSPEG